MNLGTQQNFDFTIGVISALPVEVSSLAASLLNSQNINLNGKKAWKGRLGISNVLILPGGIGPKKAADAAHTLISKGVSAILCSGAAGALDPKLQTGDLVIADWVMDAKDSNSKSECDSNWNTEAKHKAEQGDFCITNGGVISVDTPVFTPEEKSVLRKTSGGSAVDMESATVRRLARGMPFLSVRVITDDAQTTLPNFHEGWSHPVRTMKDGASFLARAGSMWRALRVLQKFLVPLLTDFSPTMVNQSERKKFLSP